MYSYAHYEQDGFLSKVYLEEGKYLCIAVECLRTTTNSRI